MKRGVSVLAAGGLQGGLQGLPSEHLKRVCARPEPPAAPLPPTGAECSATTVNTCPALWLSRCGLSQQFLLSPQRQGELASPSQSSLSPRRSCYCPSSPRTAEDNVGSGRSCAGLCCKNQALAPSGTQLHIRTMAPKWTFQLCCNGGEPTPYKDPRQQTPGGQSLPQANRRWDITPK